MKLKIVCLLLPTHLWSSPTIVKKPSRTTTTALLSSPPLPPSLLSTTTTSYNNDTWFSASSLLHRLGLLSSESALTSGSVDVSEILQGRWVFFNGGVLRGTISMSRCCGSKSTMCTAKGTQAEKGTRNQYLGIFNEGFCSQKIDLGKPQNNC